MAIFKNKSKKKKRFEGPLGEFRETDEPLYKIPKTFQQTIDVMRISENGIFQVSPQKYSRTYEFSDINYKIMSEDTQEELIFGSYSEFINSMSCPFKLTFVNLPKDMALVRKYNFIESKEDGLDSYRSVLNDNINQKMYDGSKGIERKKYLTVTGRYDSYADACDGFKTIESGIVKGFAGFKSSVRQLNASERLGVLKSIYCIDICDDTEIDVKALIKSDEDFKNILVNPAGIKFDSDGYYFHLGNKWCQALYVSNYPAVMVDTFVTDLVARPIECLISVDAIPVPKEITTTLLDRNYMGIEHSISEQQEKHNRNNAFSSDISYKRRKEKAEIEAYMTDVSENDQMQFLTSVIVVVFGDDKNMLDAAVASVSSYGMGRGVKFEKAYLKQREAFNTALPVGCMQTDYLRTMLTRNVAGLSPFEMMEIQFDGSVVCYGVNQLTKHAILGNRRKLSNGNGFYFGVTGSGKSFDCKLEAVSVHLGSADRVIIIDPSNEYIDIAAMCKGEAVIIDRKSTIHINPLDFDISVCDDISALDEVIGDKAELMIGFCSLSLEDDFNGKHKSIVERAVRVLYGKIAKLPAEERYIPILSDFKAVLDTFKIQEADDLSLSLERFTDGSFNIFNHQTNFDVRSKFLVFAIRDLGKELFPFAMLIILTTYVDKLIMNNFEHGFATWLYLDEIHEFFRNEMTAEILQKYWKKNRKYGCLNTGITQNVADMLHSYVGLTMLNNNDFFFILKQASDAEAMELCHNIGGFTDELINYVINAGRGTGVLKLGEYLVPVNNTFAKDNIVYQTFNTDFNEKNEKQMQKK